MVKKILFICLFINAIIQEDKLKKNSDEVNEIKTEEMVKKYYLLFIY